MSEYDKRCEIALEHYHITDDMDEAIDMAFGVGPYVEKYFPDWMPALQKKLDSAKNDRERFRIEDRYDVNASRTLAEKIRLISEGRRVKSKIQKRWRRQSNT